MMMGRKKKIPMKKKLMMIPLKKKRRSSKTMNLKNECSSLCSLKDLDVRRAFGIVIVKRKLKFGSEIHFRNLQYY